MERKQVNAILSDYDGTLCPTTSVRDDNSYGVGGTIPQGLEQILFRISERIPVCIISSKDYAFLHRRARFAKILSCVLGIETIIHKPHYNSSSEINNFNCIRYKHLIESNNLLMGNSKLLHDIVEMLQNQNYSDIMIEEKYSSDNDTLIGLTIGYRHLENWQFFKEKREPSIREIIQGCINANLPPTLSPKCKPFIQKYSSHPILDVYGVKCNKGLAFDNVLAQLEHKERTNIIYFGDSENDNPAFSKSSISIGINSDTRLNPQLDCNYMLNFSQLPLFLRNLTDNDFIFSDDILPIHLS